MYSVTSLHCIVIEPDGQQGLALMGTTPSSPSAINAPVSVGLPRLRDVYANDMSSCPVVGCEILYNENELLITLYFILAYIYAHARSPL